MNHTKRGIRYIMILMCILSAIPGALGKIRWSAEGNVGSGLLLGLLGNSTSTVNYRIGPSAIIPVRGWFSIRPGLMWSHKGGRRRQHLMGNDKTVY